jgi:FMN phosphatase YigB (HAD superfamily)
MLSRGWIQAWIDFLRLLRFKRFMDKIRRKAGSYAVGTVPHRAAIEDTQQRMNAKILPTIGLNPGVRALMDWLQARGTKQIVFSDYRPSHKLKALGVNEYFETVYAGEDLGHLKPGEAAFKAIIREQGIEPQQLLHIGDRVDTDGAASNEVGYQVAIIGKGADFVSASGLLEMLQKQVE